MRQEYLELENKMVQYSDLIDVPVAPVKEQFVSLAEVTELSANQIGDDMKQYTGDQILVRKEVAMRLQQAAGALAWQSPDLKLEVVYGYRALEIQQRLFSNFEIQLAETYTGQHLQEAVHRMIAVPSIAGHPAGAAVDIQICHRDGSLDMGTKIWEFVPDSYTFSPFVSSASRQNRVMLREAMMSVGFAPYDGEWWHFSYGDKEWAKYYNKPYALYEQIASTDILIRSAL
ncbi:MAG TPA: M15 family metallopeptidase [Candidatus Limnocylindrales bacterium]|nr:M15 family metallopeptidase [Candidatus Limnocylindrales bacterium]